MCDHMHTGKAHLNPCGGSIIGRTELGLIGCSGDRYEFLVPRWSCWYEKIPKLLLQTSLLLSDLFRTSEDGDSKIQVIEDTYTLCDSVWWIVGPDTNSENLMSIKLVLGWGKVMWTLFTNFIFDLNCHMYTYMCFVLFTMLIPST